MTTYRMKELQNAQSQTDGYEEFEAVSLTSAKRKSSRRQMFEGTVLELSYTSGFVVSRKVDGRWNDTEEWLGR